VKRAWQKQACIKIKDSSLHSNVLQESGNIMYDKDGPFGVDVEMSVMNRLQYIIIKYHVANFFLEYMEENWQHKTHMWMVGVQNPPYVGQGTNAIIESYHGTLKLGKNRLVGCHVDWCIHELVGDVLTQYWYQSLHKNFGFMNNKRQQLFVVGALLGARLILDTNVTLPSYDGGPTHVMSSRKVQMQYTIHNPTSKWACCNYVNAQRGHICKHQLKVLLFLHPNLAEGIIVWFWC
jgi:hypothetical protein